MSLATLLTGKSLPGERKVEKTPIGVEAWCNYNCQHVCIVHVGALFKGPSPLLIDVQVPFQVSFAYNHKIYFT